MPVLAVFLSEPIATSQPLPRFDPLCLRYVYRLELDLVTSNDQDLLEEAFRLLNVNQPKDYNERSLSVGDVLTISDTRSYRCDWVGWILLDSAIKAG
jgi:hypothetical protein